MILDCDASKLYEILEQAQQIGMMTEAYSYVATTLVSNATDGSNRAYCRRRTWSIGDFPYFNYF